LPNACKRCLSAPCYPNVPAESANRSEPLRIVCLMSSLSPFASRAKKSFFSARYKRLVRRRGAQRSIVAVGHSILKAIYHMLKNHTPFNDLTAEHYKQSVNKATAKTLVSKEPRTLGLRRDIGAEAGSVSGYFQSRHRKKPAIDGMNIGDVHETFEYKYWSHSG